jgi:8-oxo-dGTP pyrophosphatase MutT (NUDIX family)
MSEEIDVVKVVIENSEGELLVVQKSNEYDDLAGKWELVGGKINEELGENRFDAAKREVKEETNLSANSFQDVVRIVVDEFDADKPTVNCWIVYCQDWSRKISLNEEHSNYKWIKPGEFKDMEWHRDAGYNIPAMEYLNTYLKKNNDY